MDGKVAVEQLYRQLNKWCNWPTASGPRYCKDKFGTGDSKCLCVAGLLYRNPMSAATSGPAADTFGTLNKRNLPDIEPALSIILDVAKSILIHPTDRLSFLIFFDAFDIIIQGNQYCKFGLKKHPSIPAICRQGLILLCKWAKSCIGVSLTDVIVSFSDKTGGFYVTWLDPSVQVTHNPYFRETFKPNYFRNKLLQCYAQIWIKNPCTRRDIPIFPLVLRVFKEVHLRSDFRIESLKRYLPGLKRFIQTSLVLMAHEDMSDENGTILKMQGKEAFSVRDVSDSNTKFIHYGNVQAFAIPSKSVDIIETIYNDKYDELGQSRNNSRCKIDLGHCETGVRRGYVHYIEPRSVDANGFSKFFLGNENGLTLPDKFPALAELFNVIAKMATNMAEPANKRYKLNTGQPSIHSTSDVLNNFCLSKCLCQSEPSLADLDPPVLKHELLTQATLHGYQLFLAVFPLSREGTWVRIFPESVEYNHQCRNFDSTISTVWCHEQVVGRGKLMASRRDEGMWIFVPRGQLVMFPITVSFCLDARTANNGNPKATLLLAVKHPSMHASAFFMDGLPSPYDLQTNTNIQASQDDSADAFRSGLML